MAAAAARPEALVERVRERIAAHVARGQSICVAYSGGLDSTVLLDVLARLRDAARWRLSALHVHHGLSPNADAWAQSCADFARERGVALRIERVQVARASGDGLEAAARAARHAAYRTAGTDFLALAHHRDDQAETVLLQALRGTGVKGLAAMAASRTVGATVWLRPLLAEARATLREHAHAAGLAWVEDESNALTDHDRNFLRHAVLPLVAGRFPQWRESLARLAGHAAAAEEILAEVARADVARIGDGDGLLAAGLAGLTPGRRANALRQFLAGRGLPMPAQARLDEMARQLVSARADAQVLLRHGGRVLVRHAGRVAVAPAPVQATAWRVDWRGEPHVSLGAGRGEVRFAEGEGDGIALARLAAGAWRFAGRSGGERIRLRAGGPSRTLKNLLREHGVPAWQRQRLPLLFDGDALAWVPGIGVAAGYRAGAGEAGLVPQWLPAGG